MGRPDDLFDVAGRVVLVTGGGTGIGRGLTEGFARRGARVVLASRSAVIAFTRTLAMEWAEEVLGPCLFLAARAADFVTGHTLIVDGGTVSMDAYSQGPAAVAG